MYGILLAQISWSVSSEAKLFIHEKNPIEDLVIIVHCYIFYCCFVIIGRINKNVMNLFSLLL